MLEIIHAPEVTDFVDRRIDQLTSWEEFCQLPMPLNLPPKTLWELLAFIRKSCGLRVNLPGDSEPSWCYVSQETSSILAGLSYRTRQSGMLSTRLALYESRRLYIPSCLEELATALIRDGFRPDHDAIRGIVTGEREPSTAVEKIIGNTVRLRGELQMYTDWDDEAAVCEEFLERIDDGVENLEYRPRRRPCPPDLAYAYSRIATPSTLRDWVTESWGTGVHPILNVLRRSDCIWEFLPFGRWNGIMELLLRELAFIKMGNPALRFAPVSMLMMEWENDSPALGDLPFRYGHAYLRSEFGIDGSPYYTQMLRFLDLAVTSLENLVEDEVSSCETIRMAIRRDHRLNHRQQQLLEHLIEHPRDSIDVTAYEHLYDVVITTARYDLQRLVDLGFLRYGKLGKKQVFTAMPDLTDLARWRLPSRVPGERTNPVGS